MAWTVYKYRIPLEPEFVMMMPKDAEILHVAAQHNEGHLWARVDPSAVADARTFLLRGTGHVAEREGAKHVGPYMIDGGDYIFHLFEVVG